MLNILTVKTSVVDTDILWHIEYWIFLDYLIFNNIHENFSNSFYITYIIVNYITQHNTWYSGIIIYFLFYIFSCIKAHLKQSQPFGKQSCAVSHSKLIRQLALFIVSGKYIKHNIQELNFSIKRRQQKMSYLLLIYTL